MSKKFQVIGTFHEPNSFHDPYEQRRTGIFSEEGKTVYFGGSGEQEYGVEREELILRDKSFTPEQKSNALKNYFKSLYFLKNNSSKFATIFFNSSVTLNFN